MIKFKAWIYRMTGLYLAEREELQYITSKVFWLEFDLLRKNKKLALSPMAAQGLLIGIWQAKHGFTRRLKL